MLTPNVIMNRIINPIKTMKFHPGGRNHAAGTINAVKSSRMRASQRPLREFPFAIELFLLR